MNKYDWKSEILEYNSSSYRTPQEFIDGENKLYARTAIYKASKRLELPLRKSSRVKPANISQKDKDILIGHLLGDGSIFKLRANRVNPVFCITSKHKEYLEWISSTCDFLKDRPIVKRTSNDQRTNKQYVAYHIRSLSKPFLLDMLNEWYPISEKIIPRSLYLNPEIVLRWFMDDGCLTREAVKLSTDCFSVLDVEFLCNLFEQEGLNPTIHMSYEAPRIYFSKPETKKFFDYIGPCPIDVFEYKWL